MPDRRQTQSYLRNLFARRGIAPQHRYGQNFLIDLNLHELIVKTAEVGPEDVVLEVGRSVDDYDGVGSPQPRQHPGEHCRHQRPGLVRCAISGQHVKARRVLAQMFADVGVPLDVGVVDDGGVISRR